MVHWADPYSATLSVPVEPNGLAELAGYQVVRLVDGGGRELPVPPDHGLPDPIPTVERLDRVVALDAREACAHRRVRVPLHRHRPPTLDPHQQPAARRCTAGRASASMSERPGAQPRVARPSRRQRRRTRGTPRTLSPHVSEKSGGRLVSWKLAVACPISRGSLPRQATQADGRSVGMTNSQRAHEASDDDPVPAGAGSTHSTSVGAMGRGWDSASVAQLRRSATKGMRNRELRPLHQPSSDCGFTSLSVPDRRSGRHRQPGRGHRAPARTFAVPIHQIAGPTLGAPSHRRSPSAPAQLPRRSHVRQAEAGSARAAGGGGRLRRSRPILPARRPGRGGRAGGGRPPFRRPARGAPSRATGAAAGARPRRPRVSPVPAGATRRIAGGRAQTPLPAVPGA